MIVNIGLKIFDQLKLLVAIITNSARIMNTATMINAVLNFFIRLLIWKFCKRFFRLIFSEDRKTLLTLFLNPEDFMLVETKNLILISSITLVAKSIHKPQNLILGI